MAHICPEIYISISNSCHVPQPPVHLQEVINLPNQWTDAVFHSCDVSSTARGGRARGTDTWCLCLCCHHQHRLDDRPLCKPT